MPDDEAFIWNRPTPELRPRSTGAPATPEDAAGRITLRDAERRFGVKVTTLRTWARKGRVDAVRSGGPRKDQWMVTPESVAHHLSRHKPSVSPRQPARTGPKDDGSAMLVPRDAWDKLMDQLGNLHEAGLQLAEARERAAKAETEATFLRERLSELRSERDSLKNRSSDAATGTRPRRWWRRASKAR